MYIDDTYISSLDELKDIIESHTRNGKVDDDFRMEFIETFEDNTDTGLLAFAESIDTEEAKKYAEHLAAQEAKWDSLSASEQYTALVAFFNVTPIAIDLTKYIEITNVDIQDNEEVVSVNIAVKVKKPANESIRFEIKLYDRDNNLVKTLTSNTASLVVSVNQIINFRKRFDADDNFDRIEVLSGNKIIQSERLLGKARIFNVEGVKFKMIFVKGGKYKRGSAKENEEVEVPDFYIAETTVTAALWSAVVKDDRLQNFLEAKQVPGRKIIGKIREYVEGNFPKTNISLLDCEMFIGLLNEILKEQLGELYFDYPIETQWEYAARGGIRHSPYKFSGSDNIDEVTWYKGNSEAIVQPVKRKKANELGIYDMSGNIKEWCDDGFRGFPIIRGGSANDFSSDCTVYARCYLARNCRDEFVGLRLVLCVKK